MSDIQLKFHKLTNNIKKGYEDGVSKIQTSQEVLNLKEQISENQSKRLELIVTLGENYYLKYRNGEIQDEKVAEIYSELVNIDKKIFKDLKTIEEKTKADGENRICECGTPLNPEDKFCHGCGKEVELFKEEIIEKVKCTNCEEEIPASSKYCNCCGIKLS